jgi:outer membrane protein TolC
MKTCTSRRLTSRTAAIAVHGALLMTIGLSGTASAQGIASPTDLPSVLRRALDVHPSVEAAEAAADAAGAGLRVARAAWLPSFGVEASVTRFQESMLVAPLHRFDPTAVPDFDPTLMRGTLGASWTVFDGGRRGADVDRARALDRAGAAQRREVEADLLARTADAYMTVLAGREVVAAQERRETALEAEVARARQLVTEGAAAPLESLRAEAEWASVRAEGEAARQGLELAVATLARTLDLPVSTLREAVLLTPTIPPGAAPPLLPTDSAAPAALDASPGVRRARLSADAAGAAADAARAAWLPSVEALVGYNLFAGADVSAVAEWQAGVQVRYPLFTGGARSGAAARASAEAERARAEARVVEENTARAADAARTAESEARGRATALEAAVDRFTELARVERLALDEGAGTQSDWLRAEAGLFQARAGLADARFDVLRARIAWARALGLLDLDWIASLTEVSP